MADAISTQASGDRGISVPKPRPDYKVYRSPYAPQYKVRQNFHGINLVGLRRFGIMMGMFGGVGGIALLFFASGVPRVRIDILQKLPLVGEYFVKEVPPEDDPF